MAGGKPKRETRPLQVGVKLATHEEIAQILVNWTKRGYRASGCTKSLVVETAIHHLLTTLQTEEALMQKAGLTYDNA